MPNNFNTPFITFDTALASALLTKGFKLQSCQKVEGNKRYFTFHGSKQLQEAVELYEQDKLFVNARTLLNVYQDCLPQSPDQVR